MKRGEIGRESGPKKREKHHSYDESVDEPGKAIELEAVDIEKETPSEDRAAIERAERDDAEAPLFEDQE
jgi:hypothetical protein